MSTRHTSATHVSLGRPAKDGTAGPQPPIRKDTGRRFASEGATFSCASHAEVGKSLVVDDETGVPVIIDTGYNGGSLDALNDDEQFCQPRDRQCGETQQECSEWIEWKPGEEFEFQFVDTVFRIPSRQVSHPTYGDGFHWEFPASAGIPTHLIVFPERRMARVRFVDGSFESQARECVLDRIVIQRRDGNAALAITSEQEGRCTRLVVHRSGEIDEFHRFVKSDVPELPFEAIAWSTKDIAFDIAPESPRRSTVTVRQAAEIIGCHPASVEYLVRKKRLPAVKLGQRWFVEEDAVRRYRRSNRGRGRGQPHPRAM